MEDQRDDREGRQTAAQAGFRGGHVFADGSTITAASLADAYWAIWEHQTILLQLEADIAKAMFSAVMPGAPLPDLGKRFLELQSSADKVMARMRYLNGLADAPQAGVHP